MQLVEVNGHPLVSALSGTDVSHSSPVIAPQITVDTAFTADDWDIDLEQAYHDVDLTTLQSEVESYRQRSTAYAKEGDELRLMLREMDKIYRQQEQLARQSAELKRKRAEESIMNQIRSKWLSRRCPEFFAPPPPPAKSPSAPPRAPHASSHANGVLVPSAPPTAGAPPGSTHATMLPPPPSSKKAKK